MAEPAEDEVEITVDEAPAPEGQRDGQPRIILPDATVSADGIPEEIELAEEPAKPVRKRTQRADPEAAAEDPLAELKAQLAAEKSLRQTAERERDANANSAVSAQVSQRDTEISFLTTAVESAKGQVTSAKAVYAQAMRDQDFDAAADAQEAIAEATNNRARLEDGLTRLKAAPKPQPAPSADPVESLIRQAGISAPSANWLRSHPEYVTDQNLNQQLMGAVSLIQGRGIAVDSPEYFAGVEKLLDLQSADGEDIALSEAAVPQRRQPPPSPAPVSRGSNPGVPNPNTVRLNAAERETAESSWPELDPAEAYRRYGAEKLRIAKEQMQ